MADVVPLAIAAALTPTAILIALLLLLTERPRGNGGAYLAGWTLGLVLSSAILTRLALAPGSLQSVGNREPWIRPGVSLLVGVAMIVSGALTMRAGSRFGGEPPWLHRVNSVRPPAAFGIGLLLAGLSPKVILLTGAAVATVILAGEAESRGLALYILIASLPIAIPVLIVFSDRTHAPERVASWKAWLIEHQGRLLGGGSILLGLILIARAWQLASGAA
jgi:hypothetical protein